MIPELMHRPVRRRPRLLDLYCGAGGAAMGYHRAGFEVVGVDIESQPYYPFKFLKEDALDVLKWEVSDFDAIHASPPCHDHSRLSTLSGEDGTGWLLSATRDLLITTGLPWVIENVVGAPMKPTVILCGSMFNLGSNGRYLQRHRLFESNRSLIQPECEHRGQAIGVYGHSQSAPGRKGYKGSVAERREAMGIDWMVGSELAQAVPPAYTQFIGEQLL